MYINETSIYMWAMSKKPNILNQNPELHWTYFKWYAILLNYINLHHFLWVVFRLKIISSIISIILVPSSSVEIASFAYIEKNKAKTNKDSHIHYTIYIEIDKHRLPNIKCNQFARGFNMMIHTTNTFKHVPYLAYRTTA